VNAPEPDPGATPEPRATPEPEATAVSSNSRLWAAGAHLLPFVLGGVGFGFIPPLVVWLIFRDEDPFVEAHAREALNFQLSIILYGFVSLVAVLILIGILMLVVLVILVLVFQVVAGVKAASGKPFRYPLIIRFVSPRRVG